MINAKNVLLITVLNVILMLPNVIPVLMDSENSPSTMMKNVRLAIGDARNVNLKERNVLNVKVITG